jgi:hypothetical protein
VQFAFQPILINHSVTSYRINGEIWIRL